MDMDSKLTEEQSKKRGTLAAGQTVVKKKNTLVRIKGVDLERTKKLNQIGIEDANDLLQKGRTITQRKSIAMQLLCLEKETKAGSTIAKQYESVYIRHVNSWVKQVDLWRINGMDDDTAYFLVELGVRHVEDVTKIDAEKAYPMMKCLLNSQPQYRLITITVLKRLIENAKSISTKHPEFQKRLTEQLKEPMMLMKRNMRKLQLANDTKEKFRPYQTLFDQMMGQITNIQVTDILGSSSIETDDPAPVFLFRDDLFIRLEDEAQKEVEKEEQESKVDNLEVIQKGLGYLKEIEAVLPLPKTIRGKVYRIRSGESLPKEEEERRNYAFTDATVEISGIASPLEDKTEEKQNPKAYTDGNGEFIVLLPDRYNMQEAITISISQGRYKQKFILGASDVIEHVDKQKVLKAFHTLDMVLEDLEKEKERHNTTQDELERKEIGEEIALLEQQRDQLERYIKDSDPSTNNMERILRNLLADNHLESDFRESPFIINQDIFEGNTSNPPKILPSVKLMEKDNTPLYLPTDTAPSRIFNYSMLQRLVEPAISPLADPAKKSGRIALKHGVDVMEFKTKLMTSPDQWPQMSSLGIGYILNMHQAWVPDGFALGNLLYSLVLAPGEEQRLVVREKTQNYQIVDESSAEDTATEEYETSQLDNTTAAYDYAVRQLMEGSSNLSYSTKTSSFGGSFGAGGIFGGVSAMLGLSGSTCKSSGKASSSASQTNSHNEASNAAQTFQHGIKAASERIAQAKRLSISMATGQETDSVATRIIANHNHSHAMTIQYWEVMRRYRLETCVDNVDLVLFVPMKLINFLNGKPYLLGNTTMNVQLFKERYDMILKHADVLEQCIPRKYRTGLNLIKEYASYPDWNMEQRTYSSKQLEFKFRGVFLSFDDIKVTLVLRHGKGQIAGNVKYKRLELVKTFETSASLKEAIKRIRNGSDEEISAYTKNDSKSKDNLCSCTFVLPPDVSEDDLSYIRIEYAPETLNYVLHKNWYDISKNGEYASETYEYMMDKTWDLVKDRKDSDGDIRKIDYCKEMLPEAWVFPNVTIRSSELKSLGTPAISDMTLQIIGGHSLAVHSSRNDLAATMSVVISCEKPVLQYAQLQKMEETLHHIVADTMKYSQRVWASLSSDERAMMLEQYTIDMDFKDITDQEAGLNGTYDDISLLNCINVKKLLGFYGNCMLFPFTYPQKLADRLGKTAGELQDSLYRYHTNYFRVPTTTISLPTDGMIGEAVLGETNVSEEIDLTRFWNWKDSPIDSMSIDSSYLNNTDYLAGKSTKEITGLNIQGAAATTPVAAADLVSALVAKQTPSFDNITGLDQLKEVLNDGTRSAASGRDKALETSGEMAKAALEVLKGNGSTEHNKDNENPKNSGEDKHQKSEEQNFDGNQNRTPKDDQEGEKIDNPGKGSGSDENEGNYEDSIDKENGGENSKEDDDFFEEYEEDDGDGLELSADELNDSLETLDVNLLMECLDELMVIYTSDANVTLEQCVRQLGYADANVSSYELNNEMNACAEAFCKKYSISMEQIDEVN